MERTKILVADDEMNILRVIRSELENEGYSVDLAHDGEEAYEKIQKNSYGVVVLDIRMPKRDGFLLLKEVKKIDLNTIVIMMTGYGTITDAVEAMKIGASDYLTKPFDNDELIFKVRQALEIKTKSQSIKSDDEESTVEFVGLSKEMENIKGMIEKVKHLSTTVLITGESGTGKGVIASELHHKSNRRNAPFIHVNCAALPSNLIESELFGHEKGAFTGAYESKKGKFELAGEGTIFLDEISAMSLNLQAKLLTVLQSRQFERIGGVKTLQVNARIIAATNENLENAVKNNKFRLDLFYRLNVISIECPPLRYRKKDIAPLSYALLNKLNKKYNKQITGISPQVLLIFNAYEWPGNVRELENTIECAVALANNSQIEEDDLPFRIRSAIGKRKGLFVENSINELEVSEIEVIKSALDNNDGHRLKTAQELGISRRSLQYKLKKYDLLTY